MALAAAIVDARLFGMGGGRLPAGTTVGSLTTGNWGAKTGGGVCTATGMTTDAAICGTAVEESAPVTLGACVGSEARGVTGATGSAGPDTGTEGARGRFGTTGGGRAATAGTTALTTGNEGPG